MKKFVAFAISLVLVIGTVFPASAASSFADAAPGDWFYEAVEYCRENGLMSGKGNSRFAPNDNMTRAELAAVLYRHAKSPAVTASAGFSDVEPDAWYTKAVTWAQENSIVSGYGNGKFGTNDNIRREDIAAIFWRYAGRPTVGRDAEFADMAQVSGYALEAVDWARAKGIISGKGNNRFDPKGYATRAEVATILMNFCKLGSEDTPPSPDPAPDASKVLVAYFSATGTTRPLAEYAGDMLGADLYEITPQQPYTEDDLAYYTGGRADQEQDDPSARPAISGSVENMGQYDVVFIGYPIWHGQAPRIISTFLESYNFSGKTIVPFCTSHSSGGGSSDTNLHSLAPKANWLPGQRFAGGATRDEIEQWIDSLDIPQQGETALPTGTFNFETKTVLLNSGYEIPLNGLGTYSLHGDVCVDSVKSALKSGVRLIDTASAYGNEEEVGQAIREAIDVGIIRREDAFVITKIYPGSEMENPEESIQACLDRLDIGYVDMMLLHHPDRNDVKAYKAMEKYVEQGKIRSLGLSNWYVEELEEFLPQVNITPALVQNEIHPYYQENGVIPFIQEKEIVVQGWYPLGGRGHTAELLGDETIKEIAAAHGVSSAQVILRWNLQNGVVVIPGSRNPDHIKENTELYHFTLTEDEMNRIKALDRNEKHDWY